MSGNVVALETRLDLGELSAPEFSERHYSVQEVASMWGLSAATVRRMFRGEPGVLVVDSSCTGRGKRTGYATLRIPKSVAERVHRRLETPGGER